LADLKSDFQSMEFLAFSFLDNVKHGVSFGLHASPIEFFAESHYRLMSAGYG
jgi:hypothetical protein